MKDQRGHTLLEMVVAVGILALLSSIATVAGVGFLGSARTARVSSQLADEVSLAREGAIAKYERWRITFVLSAGSDVAQEYVVESCPQNVAAPSVACTASWAERARIKLETGSGILVPQVGGVPITELTFNRVGQFENTTDVDLRVCSTQATAGSVLACRSGSVGRLVRIRKFSGIIET